MEDNSALSTSNVSSEKMTGLIKSSKEIACKHLAQILDSSLVNYDKKLTELINDAQNDGVDNYYTAQTIIKAEKNSIKQTLNQQLTENFNKFLRTALKNNPDSHGNQGSSVELSLIDEEEMEEALVIDNLTKIINNEHNYSLDLLEQRFSYLFPNITIDQNNLPLSASSIAIIFNTIIKPCDFEQKAKQLFFRILLKEAMPVLGNMYKEIHKLLADSDILPNITARKHLSKKPDTKKTDTGPQEQTSNEFQDWLQRGTTSSEAQTPTPNPEQTEPYSNNSQADSFQNWFKQSTKMAALNTPYNQASQEQPPAFQAMKQLLSTQSGSGDDNNAQNGALQASFSAPTPELLDTLSTLQQVDSYIKKGGGIDREGLKKSILEELHQRMPDGESQSVQALDAETMDIIGVIFDYFYDHKALPDFIKALIGRLQIPVIKTALIDRSFLTDKSHPARLLLNELTDASLEWEKEDDAAKDQLYCKIEEIVKCIQNEYKNDIEIFQQQLCKLRSFLDEDRAVFEAAGKEIQESISASEKSEQTKKEIAEEIANIVLNNELPDDINEFIIGPWREVLTAISNNRGEEILKREEALAFIDNLIWSVEPKTNADERKELIKKLPLIINTLRKGLNLISATQDIVDQTTKMLEKYHLDNIRNKPASPSKENKVSDKISDDIDLLPDLDDDIFNFDDDLFEGISKKPHKSFDELLSEMGIDMIKDDAPHTEDKHTVIVRALESGTWVEFSDEKGEKLRGKLAWKDEISGYYVFMNRRHKVVAEKTMYGLADEFRNQQACVVEVKSLFDHALDGMTQGILKS